MLQLFNNAFYISKKAESKGRTQICASNTAQFNVKAFCTWLSSPRKLQLGYSAPLRQLCAYKKRHSFSSGNCCPVVLTVTGHSRVTGLPALKRRWCSWKWTIRLERYKGWIQPSSMKWLISADLGLDLLWYPVRLQSGALNASASLENHRICSFVGRDL